MALVERKYKTWLDGEKKEALVRLAQEQAAIAVEGGDPPFGALLVGMDGSIIEQAHNTQNSSLDPTAHAEINLLRRAARSLGNRYLSDYLVFTNAEPCPMCMAAMISAGIQGVYFGASHEQRINLPIAAAELASRSKTSVSVEGGILREWTAGEILRGRQRIEKPSTEEPSRIRGIRE